MDTRKSITLTINLDAPAHDWAEVVIPGQGRGDDVCPPIDRMELLTDDVFHALEVLARQDIFVCGVATREGEAYTITPGMAVDPDDVEPF